MTAIDTPLQPPVVLGSIWQHTNGNQYVVYDITNTQSASLPRPEYPAKVNYCGKPMGPPLPKYPVMISYCGKNGNTWSRKLSDWHRSMTLIPNVTARRIALQQPGPVTATQPQEPDASTPLYTHQSSDWVWPLT